MKPSNSSRQIFGDAEEGASIGLMVIMPNHSIYPPLTIEVPLACVFQPYLDPGFFPYKSSHTKYFEVKLTNERFPIIGFSLPKLVGLSHGGAAFSVCLCPQTGQPSYFYDGSTNLPRTILVDSVVQNDVIGIGLTYYDLAQVPENQSYSPKHLENLYPGVEQPPLQMFAFVTVNGRMVGRATVPQPAFNLTPFIETHGCTLLTANLSGSPQNPFQYDLKNHIDLFPSSILLGYFDLKENRMPPDFYEHAARNPGKLDSLQNYIPIHKKSYGLSLAKLFLAQADFTQIYQNYDILNWHRRYVPAYSVDKDFHQFNAEWSKIMTILIYFCQPESDLTVENLEQLVGFNASNFQIDQTLPKSEIGSKLIMQLTYNFSKVKMEHLLKLLDGDKYRGAKLPLDLQVEIRMQLWRFQSGSVANILKKLLCIDPDNECNAFTLESKLDWVHRSWMLGVDVSGEDRLSYRILLPTYYWSLYFSDKYCTLVDAERGSKKLESAIEDLILDSSCDPELTKNIQQFLATCSFAFNLIDYPLEHELTLSECLKSAITTLLKIKKEVATQDQSTFVLKASAIRSYLTDLHHTKAALIWLFSK